MFSKMTLAKDASLDRSLVQGEKKKKYIYIYINGIVSSL